MAEFIGRRRHQKQQKPPSRLQRRAPASLQINRSTDWNVAIPLLSPLGPSPPPNLTAEIDLRRDLHQAASIGASDQSKPAAAPFNKWQHPAAPFCYDPDPFAPFVRVDSSSRS